METTPDKQHSWLDQPIQSKLVLSREAVIFTIIIALALFSRFYNLEARVMSHDENSHVYYSWRLYRGEGFSHDPLMHGPLQFHLVALSYFVFGDNDFTARIPAALFSVATVGFMWFYRRYLGNTGAIIAAVLLLISPYMLYYGRYVRNEALAAFFGVVTIYGILRYIDSGKERYLYILTAVTALHFTSKETAFIYTAQALVFLTIYLVFRIFKSEWHTSQQRNRFLIALIIGFLLLSFAGLSWMIDLNISTQEVGSTITPSVEVETPARAAITATSFLPLFFVILSLGAFLFAFVFLVRGYTLERLKRERSFGLLIVLTTLILPHLSAFPVQFMGWNIPTNASEVMALTSRDIVNFAIFIIPFTLLAVVIGLWWNSRLWLINAAIFYGIFTVFFTTIFTNGAGFFTGLVGSLGYWLEQQGVNRGDQPGYYYWLVQIPIYEFLPALGTLLTFVIAIFLNRRSKEKNEDSFQADTKNQIVFPGGAPEVAPVVPLICFWAITSLVAYTIAGEKMPWLTVHITFPLIMCAGWSLGYLIDSTDWSVFHKPRPWLILLLLPIFILSTISALGSLLGTNPPLQGKELEHLRATSTFLSSALFSLASGIGLYKLFRPWQRRQIIRVITLFGFTLLAFLTARSATLSSYINFDNANELLVYAHSAGGVKQALAQIEEISHRTTDGQALEVAYDNVTSYPYWWYLRDYPNALYYGEDPTRSLREVPAILVGDENFGKIEPIVGQAYDRFEYIRIWWPNQDYYDLTWERIYNALRDPMMRAALFQIWLNHDYSLYGVATNKDMSLPNWSPSARMRLYIRKDIVSSMWNYGVAPSTEPIVADPYEQGEIQLVADKLIGDQGDKPGLFQNPKGIDIAPDGSLYVADSDNHRIQHLDQDGTVIHTWGSFADLSAGNAPGGTFNQPWGVAVGPDGSVYIADTWNHRIQKFTAEGEFVSMWGNFGQAESPDAFWGPRDVTVNERGRVFVTDTGNKRVVVFDSNGNYITQFGGAGFSLGQFDEPVGISVDSSGRVYVADTWNQRIQMFEQTETGEFVPIQQWDVIAWFGQSLDNKPFLDLDESGNLFATDPEGYRVLQFGDSGEFKKYWGDFGVGLEAFNLPAGIAADLEGGVWVVDSGNNRILHFIIQE